MGQNKKSLDFLIDQLIATDRKKYGISLSDVNLKIYRNDANDILLNFTKEDQVHEYKYNNYMNKVSGELLTLDTKVEKLDINPTVYIYFNSGKDRRDAIKFIELLQSANNVPEYFSNLISGFKSNFVTSKNNFDEQETLFDQLSKYLENCAHEWKMDEIFAPIAAVCQSSGHGKTRCMYEFSKRHFCVYLCLRDRNEGGFPRPSPISQIFLQYIDRYSDYRSYQIVLYCLINAALNLIEKLKNSIPAAETSKFDENERILKVIEKFNESQMWFYLESVYSESDYLDELNEQISAIEKTNSKDTQYLDNEFKRLTKRFNDVMTFFNIRQGLHFVFDEARIMFEKSYKDQIRLICLRELIQYHLRDLKIAFVVVDTKINFEIFLHEKNTYSPSDRSAMQLKPIYQPFYKIYFIDYLIPEGYSDALNNFVSKKEFPLDFLLNRDPVKSLFCYGRPMWASLSKTSTYQGSVIVDLAMNKLLCSRSAVVENEYQSLACLCVRTNLFITYHVDYTDQMIAQHMKTLIWVENDRKFKEARYFSEPILAEASAHVMNNTKNLERILQDLNKYVQLFDLNRIGSTGELVVQLMLLLAFDKAARNKSKYPFNYYSLPLTVKEFLFSLIGETSTNLIFDGDSRLDKLKSGYVCFTHFIKRIHPVSYEDVINHFIGRAAAGIFENSHIGNDLFIPIVYEEDSMSKISHILIQIKNGFSPTTTTEITSNNFPSNLKRNENDPVPPFLPLTIDLANNSSHNIVLHCVESNNIRFFALNGFNKIAYPLFEKDGGLGNVFNSMQSLLNAKKAKFLCQKYGDMVLEHVAKECIDFNKI